MLFDVAIVGGGPAGMTAGIYARMAGLNTVIIEKNMFGGQIALTQDLKNFPTIKQIDGVTFSLQLLDQVTELGAEMVYAEVYGFEDLSSKTKKILTSNGTIEAKTIILTMGASARKLGIRKEQEYIGRGVGYCAVCDGALYKGKDIAVVGGGNTAFEDVKYLSNLANKVYLIHYRETFKANQNLIDEASELVKTGKLEILTPYEVESILGEKKLEKIILKNKIDGTEKEIELSAMFIAIGRTPEIQFVKGTINTDEYGYILANENMETNVPGVFVAGDIRKKQLRQVITACSDGAIAATNANIYIKKYN